MIRSEERDLRKRFLPAAWLILAAIGVSGCKAASVPHRDCCYKGYAPVAYLRDLHFEMDNGERKSYLEVFPGLKPDTSLLTLPMAFEEADIDLVVYASLKRVLPTYDANSNRWIERPELLVLYLREGARGLGQPVKAIGLDKTVGALILPQSEVGGLTRYLKDARPRMTPDARKLFNDLDLLGLDIQSEVDGPDPDSFWRLN